MYDHTMQVLAIMALPAAALLGPSACKSKNERHYWADVPYCDSGSGFAQPIRVIRAYGNQGEVVALTGSRPDQSSVYAPDVTVAVVACADWTSLVGQKDLDRVRSALLAGTVPTVCPGERVILPPTQVRARTTSRRGYVGALTFPKVDPTELACTRGALAYGEVADQK